MISATPVARGLSQAGNTNMNHIQTEELQADRKALDEAAREHLAMLHRLLIGVEPEMTEFLGKRNSHAEMEAARRYLQKHLRNDADFADLGRPLKHQYNSRANDQDNPREE